jgi:cytoskeleton protein RodZ
MTLTVGQRLHIARESKGLSLQDVSHSTRIPVPRLRDLEEDTYTSFGSLTYARNFLKDYSRLMEVNADEVLDQMHSPALGGTRDYQYLLKNYGTWTRSSTRASREHAPSMARSGSMGLMAGICAALLVFGMGMLLGAAFLGGEHKTTGQAPPVPETEMTRRAQPAPLPETQVASFSSAPVQEAAPVPAAVPAAGAKAEVPFKRPNVAPGVILKALPVEEPKPAKAKH